MFRSLAAAPLLAVLSVAPLPPLRSPALPDDTTAYARWYRALREAGPDPQAGTTVTDLTLKRDVGVFHFAHGTLHLLPPTDGRTWGAVFVGEGAFTMNAPISVEQAQLRKTFGAPSVDQPFRSAVLFFTDTTFAELGHALTFGAAPVPGNAKREVEEAVKYVSDKDGWVSTKLMVPLLDHGPGFFYAHVAEDRGDPLIFAVDPYAFEEISLSRKAGGKTHGQVPEVVSQFNKESDYTAGSSLPQEALDLVAVDQYELDSTIDDGLHYAGVAVEHVRRLVESHPWVPFTLYPDLKVDSVRWVHGPAVPFVRPKDSPVLWLDLSTSPQDTPELAFYYHGDFIDRSKGLWVDMKTFDMWYPAYQFNRPAMYRLTFHTPKKYRVATVGVLVSEDTVKDVVTRVWQTPSVRQMAFNIGAFTSRVVRPDSPRITVQLDEAAHYKLSDMAIQARVALPEQADMLGTVGTDLSQAFSFFGQAFGPTTVQHFTATEIRDPHGEAYPGLVLLSWTTYQTTARQGYDDMFRAHEVAHQWWGIGVRPATYHDWWMAEGFSEFAGIWYMARVRGSVDLYQDRLKESRDAILARRDDAAPIWLGTRAGTSRHPEDYQTVVYDKGAWVLHMIRSLLSDYDGGKGEDAFNTLMRDFFSSHRGKTASTGEFQQAVAQQLGQENADWFFREWVYGSAIPTYHFSYTLQPQANGEVKVRVRVRQEHVPHDFKMIVPILLDFGDRGTAVVRILVTGPVTELDLPLLPMKPESVEFNPFEAVLAETKTEGWKGP